MRLETFQFFVLQLEENRALKCEIENYKNDLQESRHNLEVANEKLDSYTNSTEKEKASSEQLMNEELQRLKDINSSQKEEISTVCVVNTVSMGYKNHFIRPLNHWMSHKTFFLYLMQLQQDLSSALEELIKVTEGQRINQSFIPCMDISFDQIEFDKDGASSDSR